ncbi:glycosyltransferase family 2 protein [Catenuloplanes sp. NPDC051500]|uniref:glycosyltransferase family 2 protein n=1 Tax=Catenuloplanes sp. NPDC051500 TaxID=3363959 RepID=UPI00379BE817
MSSDNPLVSVILPHYNRAHLLRITLAALAAQNYAPIEVILSDDASTDDSRQVAASMGTTVVHSPVNRGPSAARNRGAEHAKGDILLFVDSDIALDPDAVGNTVTMLRDHPELGAVGGILRPESLHSRTPAARYRAVQMYKWWMPTHRPTLELHSCLIAVPAKVYAQIGGFNENLREIESADYRNRLADNYPVKITDVVSGRHEHDHRVGMILRKVFIRARASTIAWRKGELPGDSLPRAIGGVLLVGAVAALPLPALLGPVGAIPSAALAATGVALDAGTYRHAFASEGPVFGVYFSGVHVLVTLAGTIGGGLGVLQRVLTRPRRPALQAG